MSTAIMNGSDFRPICAACTRNARTIDTPKAHVRVEHATVMRTPECLVVLAWCHGDVERRQLPENTTEDGLMALEVFRGPR